MALQPGSTLTTGVLAPAAQSFPPDKVRIALYYGINWGYTESAPQQAVLAVWYTQDSAWRGSNHTDADSIVSAAANAPGMPSWNPAGRSVLQLASAGQVSLSQLTFAPSEGSPTVGNGTLLVTNTSNTPLTVHVPYGAVFGTGSEATLVWAVGMDASDGPPAPPSSATATVGTPPSATATMQVEQPTSTPRPVKGMPIATSAGEMPTQTALPPQKSSPTARPKSVLSPTATSTETATPTDTATATGTATNLSTGTATSMPANTATNTRVATATSAATSTRVLPTVVIETVVIEKAQPNATKRTSSQAVATQAQPEAAPKTWASTSAETSKTNPTVGTNSAQVQQKGVGNTTGNAKDNANEGVSEAKTAEQGQGREVIPLEQGAKAPSGKSQAAAQSNAPIQAVVPLSAVPTASKQDASTNSAVPPPVGTAITSPTVSGASNPPAVQTVFATVPPKGTGAVGSGTGSPTAFSTPVLKVTVSPTATGNAAGSSGNPSPPAPVPSAQTGQLGVPPAVPTKGEVATATVQAQPTKLVDIAPAPTAPGEQQASSPPPPIIDAAGDKAPPQSGGTTVGTSSGQQTTAGNTGSTGPAPSSNPHTGAGPSSLPMWLLLASGVLVLGGWKMRRLAGEAPAISQAAAES